MTRTDAMVGLKSWVKNNPHAYGLICGWFCEDVRNGRRPSTKRYAEQIREHPANSKRPDAVYRFDNSMTSALARLLAADYPEHAHLLHMRQSKYDPPSARPYDAIPPAALEMGRLFI